MKLPNLAKVRESKGLTQEQLAEKTGLTRGAIGNYESGGGAKDANAQLIADALGVDLIEIVEKSNGVQATKGVQEIENRSVRPYWNENGEGVPYYDVDVFAGDVIALNDQHFEPVSYIKLPGASDCDFSCRVSGNSMANKIFSGAIIICKEIRNKGIIAYGEVHLVATAEQRLVKYVRKHPTKPECIVLRSHNTEYDDIDVMRDEIERLFLVKVIVNQEQM